MLTTAQVEGKRRLSSSNAWRLRIFDDESYELVTPKSAPKSR